MAPSDKARPPFRWEFLPQEAMRDKAIHWRWRAYDQAGRMVMQSGLSFESREECMEDAVMHGYRTPG